MSDEIIKSLDDLTMSALGNVGKLFSVDALQAIKGAGESLFTAVSVGAVAATNLTQSAIDMASSLTQNSPSMTPETSSTAVEVQKAVAIASSTNYEIAGTLASPTTGMSQSATNRGTSGPAV